MQYDSLSGRGSGGGGEEKEKNDLTDKSQISGDIFKNNILEAGNV